MADTAIIKETRVNDASSFIVLGIFTDTATFKRDFETVVRGAKTLEDVNRQLYAALVATRASDDVMKSIPPGPFALTPPAATKPPTPEEEARALYFKEVQTLITFRSAFAPDNQIVIDQDALVAGLFKREYYD